MHDVLDTERIDYGREIPWPQKFKAVIRERLGAYVIDQFAGGKSFAGLYQKAYRDIWPDYRSFVQVLANAAVIGAENGADQALEKMARALAKGEPLPILGSYVHHLWPFPAPAEIGEAVRSAIVEEYAREHLLEHAFEDHYLGRWPDFTTFIAELADNLVLGLLNGAEDILAAYYVCFLKGAPLPVARRRPMLLKTW